MKLKIAEPNKKISLDEIVKFQKKFKLNLPIEYIDFMLESNGGFCHSNFYFKTKNRKLKSIDGMWVREFYSLDEISKMLKMRKRIPDEDEYPEYDIYKYIVRNSST